LTSSLLRIQLFMTEPWYLVDDINEIDSPAILIYKDRVQHNIALAIQLVGDAGRLRPHVKTHKSAEVTKLMLEAGISKFKCATIAEAEMLAQCGAPDVLLAYQPAGPKIRRFLKLMQQYRSVHFSCLVDSIAAVNLISKEAVDQQLEVKLFIDVNVGMDRTGVTPEHASTLYKACNELGGIKVVGLHGYDGHINDAGLAVRQQRADEAFGRLIEVQEYLRTNGTSQPVIIMGGSPTFGIHAQRKDVECSPGTFVYWDRNYQKMFPDLAFLPAALVLCRVVSIVNETRICLDLGHKSLASENPLNRRVYFLNAEDLIPVSHSEEHMVVETTLPNRYKIGDVLYGMPYHICPTCALYERAYVIEHGKLKEEWQTVARDRKILA
jgi:D-serine deaminase-like pyridoxal phosphate-dependent protein